MRIPALTLLALVFPGLFPLQTTASEKPNIVLFLADDLGWTGLSCFGSDLYETPHLDRLAEGGLKFTNAYSACTVCSPSRAALMTGMTPAQLHLTTFIAGQNRPYAKLNIPDWTLGLEDRYITLAEALKAGGYRTWQIGKWHLDFPGQNVGPTAHGFDTAQDRPPGSKGHFLSDQARKELGLKTNFATDFFGQHAAEKILEDHEDPFFMYFAFHVPHTPVRGREDLVEYYQEKITPDLVHDNPHYAAMVKSMDDAVGHVVTALKQSGQLDNTLIIFTSDNGGLTQRNGKHDHFTENLPLRRGKGSAYEGGTRVPTIMHWPGVIEPNSTCDEPIMGIDVYPTLLEITGIDGSAEHNAAMEGMSLTALLEDPNTELDRDLHWHFPHYHAGGDSPYSAIRSGKWRLVELFEDGSLELYDLSEDLSESTNLAAARPEIADELHQRLIRWRAAVDAQMMTENPDFDPERATYVAKRKK
ncbi:MAG: sulfatase [Verrucomicrobiota bacterium]